MAVQEARNGSDVVVNADEVDILCLLMHHCKDVLGKVFKLSKRPMKVDKLFCV